LTLRTRTRRFAQRTATGVGAYPADGHPDGPSLTATTIAIATTIAATATATVTATTTGTGWLGERQRIGVAQIGAVEVARSSPRRHHRPDRRVQHTAALRTLFRTLVLGWLGPCHHLAGWRGGAVAALFSTP
jgi:hypothetical protein